MRPLLLLSVVALAACGGSSSSSKKTAGGGGPPVIAPEIVQLQRDGFGIPHIVAETDAGAFYGAGWAAAEDRLFQLHWHRLMIRGRMAEFFGPGPEDEYLVHDRTMRLAGYQRQAEAALQAMDPAERELLEAFARGVNDYAASADAVLHPHFARYGVPVEAWTAADSIAAWLRIARNFTGSDPEALDESERLHEFEELVDSLGGDVQAAIDQTQPVIVFDDEAAAIRQADVPAARQSAIQAYADQHALSDARKQLSHATPRFSHAWVVAGSRSTTGRALLHGDPQIRIQTVATFWEVHVRGETFEVRGMAVPGTLNVLVGSTPDVAWGVTALGMDQADLFRLEVDPADHPGEYQLDGGWLPFENVADEEILIAGGGSETVTYRECAWGPVVTPVAKDLQPGEEFALRSIALGSPPQASLSGYLAMYRSQDVDAFHTALEGVHFPSMNVVFGDASGAIAYRANGKAPLRSPDSLLAGDVAQDGSESRFDWVETVPHELMPWITNPPDGYLLSANHMPVGSWYPIPLGLGTGNLGDTARSRRLRERLQAVSIFSPDDVYAIHLDTVSPVRRDIARLARMIHNAGGQASPLSLDAVRALAHLEKWLDAGAEMTLSVNEGALAAAIEPFFRPGESPAIDRLIEQYGSGENGRAHFLKSAIALAEAGTDPGPDAAAFVDKRLADALAKVLPAGPGPADWAASYEGAFLLQDFEVWRSIEGFPSLESETEIAVGPLTCVDGTTLLSQLTQTYSQLVEIGLPDGAQSVLPLGQSEHQTPGELDQKGLYEGMILKASPMSEAGIASLPPVTMAELEFLAEPDPVEPETEPETQPETEE